MQRIFTFRGHKHIDLDSILEISTLTKNEDQAFFSVKYILNDLPTLFRIENNLMIMYNTGFAGAVYEYTGIKPDAPREETVEGIMKRWNTIEFPAFEKSYNELLAAWKERSGDIQPEESRWPPKIVLPKIP